MKKLPERPWYVLFVLALCYMLSFVDRQIISLLVGPIKHDLKISDTQIGLLQGLAFAMFYSLVGLPLGRWADATNRRNLAAGGVLLWSAFTAACSGAKSFGSLFAGRVGVGIGEATLSPATYSMVSDMFPAERLGVALSVLCMGVFWGSSMALIVGGTVVDLLARAPLVTAPLLGVVASWRLTFVAVGAPGVFVALLLFSVREPLRRGVLQKTNGEKLSFQEGLGEIRSRWPSLALLSGGMVCQATCLFGFLGWAPAFFERVHGWSAGEVGRTLGSVVLIFGCLGMYTGGRLCDAFQAKGIADGPVRVGLPSAAGNCILFAAAMLAPKAGWTLALSCAAMFFVALPMGTTVAALQLIFPNQLRGQVSSVYLFVINMGGLTLGPLLPGLFNDYLFKNDKMIGPSLAITTTGAGAVMLLLFWSALRHYREHRRLSSSPGQALSAWAG